MFTTIPRSSWVSKKLSHLARPPRKQISMQKITHHKHIYGPQNALKEESGCVDLSKKINQNHNQYNEQRLLSSAKAMLSSISDLDINSDQRRLVEA